MRSAMLPAGSPSGPPGHQQPIDGETVLVGERSERGDDLVRLHDVIRYFADYRNVKLTAAHI